MIGALAISEKVVWWVVRQAAQKAAIEKVAPHDLRRTCPGFVIQPVADLSKSSSCLGTDRSRPRSVISVPGSGSCTP